MAQGHQAEFPRSALSGALTAVSRPRQAFQMLQQPAPVSVTAFRQGTDGIIVHVFQGHTDDGGNFAFVPAAAQLPCKQPIAVLSQGVVLLQFLKRSGSLAQVTELGCVFTKYLSNELHMHIAPFPAQIVLQPVQAAEQFRRQVLPPGVILQRFQSSSVLPPPDQAGYITLPLAQPTRCGKHLLRLTGKPGVFVGGIHLHCLYCLSDGVQPIFRFLYQ